MLSSEDKAFPHEKSVEQDRTSHYRREYYLGWTSFILLLLGFASAAAQSGLSLPLFVVMFFLLLVLPLVFWWVLVERFGVAALRHLMSLDEALVGLVRRKEASFLYFFAIPSFPARLWGRFLQLLFLVFFSSSLVVPRVSFVNPPSTTNDFVESFIVGILALFFLAPILVLVWTYQDCGLKRYESERVIVSPVGIRLAQLLSGIGTLGTFARFAVSASQNQGEAVAFGLGLFLMLFPPCLLLTSIFHRKREPRMIRRLFNTEFARRAGFKNVRIE